MARTLVFHINWGRTHFIPVICGHFDPVLTPKIQPTWKVLIQIILGLLEEPDTRQAIAHYQARRLGSETGHTLLTELMPLPAPNTGEWPYQDLFADPRLSSRDLYLKTIKRQRIQLLRDLIDRNRPRLAICYGKSFWPDFRRLFPGTDFQQALLQHPSDQDRKPTPVDRFEHGRTPYSGLVVMIAHPVACGANARWWIKGLVRHIQTYSLRDGSAWTSDL